MGWVAPLIDRSVARSPDMALTCGECEYEYSYLPVLLLPPCGRGMSLAVITCMQKIYRIDIYNTYMYNRYGMHVCIMWGNSNSHLVWTFADRSVGLTWLTSLTWLTIKVAREQTRDQFRTRVQAERNQPNTKQKPINMKVSSAAGSQDLQGISYYLFCKQIC